MKSAVAQLVECFDRGLGDPHDPLQIFSFARCQELDEREEFPTEICQRLDGLGLARRYVPAALGGELHSYEELAALVRLVARRDLTVAVAHVGTFLGAASVWLAGRPEQAAQLAREVEAGSVVSLALSEREHGSDLLANRVRTSGGEDWYRIAGEKWLIGNASRGQLVCVLARTEPVGGPRGFSLLLVDKRRLAPGSYRCLPAVRTVGIRGADISGIEFREAEVPADALVGAAGTGLETVLKCLQLTRTLCGALSLGTADHALRLAVRNSATGANPALAGAYADLLVAEAVTLVAARAVHALPGELSVASAAVKAFVPTLVEELIADLARELGPALLLAEPTEADSFQKLERDHHIMSIFDGNTAVNLNALVNQFDALARGYRRARVDQAGLAAATTLSDPLPAADTSRLALFSRHGSSLVQSLPAALAELTDPHFAPLAAALAEQAEQLHTEMAELRPSAREVPAMAYELARRYTVLFAAAGCVQLWLHNRTADDSPFWQHGDWLRAALIRLLGQLGAGSGELPADLVAELTERLRHQHKAGRLFSLLDCQLEESA
ncbi:acyl-CoA dehydrogenase [Streptomyces tateyamensis]|uniref:Acyl-CoA dehydrogenase n=1 Tax=Streptomyces tateyamensis TaxID=565073 RepID=A0A2V4P9I0_9ACTN|nr:acyl-CoA dehydrogenase [Streptomyces tateyamensis]PYC87368.1 acyl-CoA dehydrogenase [Streptomyces tateyamensis]